MMNANEILDEADNGGAPAPGLGEHQ